METVVDALPQHRNAATAIACNHDGHVAYRASSAGAASVVATARPGSVFVSMQAIYEAEGLAGLWRGNQTRMIKVAPSCAIMITCYELGKRFLTLTPDR